MDSKYSYFVSQALQNANKSPLKHKCGAVLVYKGKIISNGYNHYKRDKNFYSKKCVL